MISNHELSIIEDTRAENAVYVTEYDGYHRETHVTLCLYCATDEEQVTFSDRCGNLHAYDKATYGIEWDCRPVTSQELVKWHDVAPAIAKAFRAEFVGDEILTRTEDEADRIADLLEALGLGYANTGYYDPEEDERNNEVDDRTGKWYVSVD